MSRHRDVRNMDYSEEYDGYDDVYGHSVDDDYSISPSHRQFMYNRERTRESESDIVEEDEVQIDLQKEPLSDIQKIKLESCIKQINLIMGPINLPRNELFKIILDCNFNSERAIGVILDNQKQTKPIERKEKDETDLHNDRNISFGLKKTPILFNLHADRVNSSPSLLKFASKLHNNIVEHNSNFMSEITLNNGGLPTPQSTTPETLDQFSSKRFAFPKFGETNSSKLGNNFSNYLNETTEPKQSNSHVNNFLFKLKQNEEDKELNNLTKIENPTSNKRNQDNVLTFMSKLKIPQSKSVVDISANKAVVDSDWHIDLTLALNDDKYGTKFKSNEPSQKNPLTKDWHIDLSAALKKEDVCVSVLHRLKISENQFDIPFVDCEHDIEPIEHPNLICNLDVSNILKTKIGCKKKASAFGKILCLRYGAKYRNIYSNNILGCKISRFTFSTQSPDDKIIKHLARR